MASPDNDTVRELERIERYQDALVEALGEDLRRCISYLHDDSDGLTVTLRLLYRFGADPLTRLGAVIYYDRLTAAMGTQHGDCCGR